MGLIRRIAVLGAVLATLGQGRVPAPPSFVPWQIRTAYYAAAYAHTYVARSYASRGLCSAFRLSICPWESQGVMARRC